MLPVYHHAVYLSHWLLEQYTHARPPNCGRPQAQPSCARILYSLVSCTSHSANVGSKAMCSITCITFEKLVQYTTIQQYVCALGITVRVFYPQQTWHIQRLCCTSMYACGRGSWYGIHKSLIDTEHSRCNNEQQYDITTTEVFVIYKQVL